jgi:hypothetical protein
VAQAINDTWLSVPQSVLLRATGDLARARNLNGCNPALLVVKVIRALPPTNIVPLNSGAGKKARAKAWRMARTAATQPSTDPYGTALEVLTEILAAGLASVKGSRTPYGPIEFFDPTEFTRLILVGFDAVHKQKGVTAGTIFECPPAIS